MVHTFSLFKLNLSLYADEEPSSLILTVFLKPDIKCSLSTSISCPELQWAQWRHPKIKWEFVELWLFQNQGSPYSPPARCPQLTPASYCCSCRRGSAVPTEHTLNLLSETLISACFFRAFLSAFPRAHHVPNLYLLAKYNKVMLLILSNGHHKDPDFNSQELFNPNHSTDITYI